MEDTGAMGRIPTAACIPTGAGAEVTGVGMAGMAATVAVTAAMEAARMAAMVPTGSRLAAL